MARRGLTLIELLVVVGVISLLLALSLPALMRARNQAQGVVCAQNQKTLSLAWLLYKDENDDRLVGGYVDTTGKRPQAWVQGPTGAGSVIDREKEGIRQGMLFRYAGGKVDIYHCPADQRRLIPGQMAYRTYSAAGGANGEGWQNTYTPAERYSEILQPASKYVLVEEADPHGWNKGSYVINPLGELWVDPLAVWHSGDKSTLGFADGHVEMHHWVDRSTVEMSENQVFFCPVPSNEGEDLRFMIGGFPQKAPDASKNGKVG
jgi:prepilin-type N-terminal cleavage/methylation domain-containing protein/prepilin-type processing-associated H-X9-DG protein